MRWSERESNESNESLGKLSSSSSSGKKRWTNFILLLQDQIQPSDRVELESGILKNSEMDLRNREMRFGNCNFDIWNFITG